MPAKKKQESKWNPVMWASLRISLGFVFLWAFLDKLFGLGFSTCRDAKTEAVSVMCEKAWANGGSPTIGFLKFGTKGPFGDFFQGLAGATWADWFFMFGLLGIGVALIIGAGIKIATISGGLLMFLMWLATLWPANNPFMDDHLIYIIVLWGIYLNRNNMAWSIGSWWCKQPIVKKYPVLE